MVNSQSGQVAVEYILITVVLVAVSLKIVTEIKNRGMIANLATGPSEILRGMVESGTWETADKAKAEHPGLLRRHVSIDPR